MKFHVLVVHLKSRFLESSWDICSVGTVQHLKFMNLEVEKSDVPVDERVGSFCADVKVRVTPRDAKDSRGGELYNDLIIHNLLLGFSIMYKGPKI